MNNFQIDWLETIGDIFSLTPEITVDGSELIIVREKTYFIELAALLDETSTETIGNISNPNFQFKCRTRNSVFQPSIKYQ